MFGTGPASAWLMLVGEQPGDREDPAGEPFVGPAGKLLDQALQRAGIARVPTIHPSAIVRREPAERGDALDAFVADLRVAAARRS